MREISIDKAKEIILATSEAYDFKDGRDQSLFNFTLLVKEAEVYSIPEIESIGRSSGDLVHLSGVHKFKYSPCKADELRTFWTRMWDSESFKEITGLQSYIVDTLETGYRAGKARRAYGLFTGSAHGSERRPWHTPEWYELRKVVRPVLAPMSEFYPYIAQKPTEEHDFLLAVDALVPKTLPKQIRGDICQDMIVAILSGETTIGNIRDAVPRYIKYFFKKEPSKYGDLSLDAPIISSSYKGGNQVMTLGETIAAEFAR